MLLLLMSPSVLAADETFDSYSELMASSSVGVAYRGHIENKGDMPLNENWIEGPDELGTVGEGLRLEAFWIRLSDAPEGLHIQYEVHVQNKGWMGTVQDGEMAGTNGEGLRIEAIKIKLVDDAGNESHDYAVLYRGHIQNYGDTDWFSDGKVLGTTGSGLRLEALEIKIEKTGSDLTAYNKALVAVSEADYTAETWAIYQKVVAANVMNGDNRQFEVDAATAAIISAQKNLKAKPQIFALSAGNSKTITIIGTGLMNLGVTDITVAENTIASYTADADGKTGIVTLNSDLITDEVTNVTIWGEVYPVTYAVAFTTLQIVETIYDDDTLNQYIAITMDGKPVTTAELISAGYHLSFSVYSANEGEIPVSGFFSDAVTGKLEDNLNNSDLAAGELPPAGVNAYIQLQASKGSTVVSTGRSPVIIKNIQLPGDIIVGSQLTNTSLTNSDDFVMNSRTLVTGETASYMALTVKNGAIEKTVTEPQSYQVKSSDTKIISVNANDQRTITANATGTATITITYGNVTRTETITVTDAQRSPERIAVDKTNVTLASNKTAPVAVKMYDQYGDPCKGHITADTSNAETVPLVTNGITTTLDEENPATLIINGWSKGSARISFLDTVGSQIGITTVQVTVV